tara:strand:+ start:24387 stop:27017 length:2631 start_codon:yes stop_codon:yes gene_type:complete
MYTDKHNRLGFKPSADSFMEDWNELDKQPKKNTASWAVDSDKYDFKKQEYKGKLKSRNTLANVDPSLGDYTQFNQLVNEQTSREDTDSVVTLTAKKTAIMLKRLFTRSPKLKDSTALMSSEDFKKEPKNAVYLDTACCLVSFGHLTNYVRHQRELDSSANIFKYVNSYNKLSVTLALNGIINKFIQDLFIAMVMEKQFESVVYVDGDGADYIGLQSQDFDDYELKDIYETAVRLATVFFSLTLSKSEIEDMVKHHTNEDYENLKQFALDSLFAVAYENELRVRLGSMREAEEDVVDELLPFVRVPADAENKILDCTHNNYDNYFRGYDFDADDGPAFDATGNCRQNETSSPYYVATIMAYATYAMTKYNADGRPLTSIQRIDLFNGVQKNQLLFSDYYSQGIFDESGKLVEQRELPKNGSQLITKMLLDEKDLYRCAPTLSHYHVTTTFTPRDKYKMVKCNVTGETFDCEFHINNLISCFSNSTSMSSSKKYLDDVGRYPTVTALRTSYQDGNFKDIDEIENTMVGGRRIRKHNHINMFGGDGDKPPLGVMQWVNSSGPNLTLTSHAAWNLSMEGKVDKTTGVWNFYKMDQWDAKIYKNYQLNDATHNVGAFMQGVSALAELYYHFLSANTTIYASGEVVTQYTGTHFRDMAKVPPRGVVTGHEDIIIYESPLQAHYLGSLPLIEKAVEQISAAGIELNLVLNDNSKNTAGTASKSRSVTLKQGKLPPYVGLHGGGDKNFELVVNSLLGENYKQYSNLVGGAMIIEQFDNFNASHIPQKFMDELEERISQLENRGITIPRADVERIRKLITKLSRNIGNLDTIFDYLKKMVTNPNPSDINNLVENLVQYLKVANETKDSYKSVRKGIDLIVNINRP